MLKNLIKNLPALFSHKQYPEAVSYYDTIKQQRLNEPEPEYYKLNSNPTIQEELTKARQMSERNYFNYLQIKDELKRDSRFANMF